MPLQDIKLRPGVNREGTPTSVEGTWVESDKVRFRAGAPEKIGGWLPEEGALDVAALAPPFGKFWGVARHLFNWLTLVRYNMLGIGTSMKYYIQNGLGGVIYDVTPIDVVTLPGDVTFAATNGSTTLSVIDPGHNTHVGDFVIFSGAVGLGGAITAAILNREYVITAVIDANTYTVTTPVPANALDVGNGGAAVVAAYELPIGLDFFMPGIGWGAGGWGGVTGGVLTGWGEAAPVPTAIGLQPRLWSASNFGERLLANPRGGGLYLWTPNGDPSIVDRMVLLTGGDTPVKLNQVLVSDASRFVLAFGANDYGSPDQDPMLVRWSEQESYTEWTPSATNQAGSYRLSRGSVIIGAVQTRQEVLVWTDAALYSMQYQGPPFVWSTNILADNISILGPNAAISVNNVTYWMGMDKFYVYNGRVDTLPCSLLRFVFNDLNVNNGFQAHVGHNEAFNELWWFYCSANSTVIDRYVIFNYLENAWSYGSMDRTAWLDSPLRMSPIAATLGNQLVYHEQGTDDGTLNPPGPIAAHVASAPVDLDAGQHFQFIRRLQPDISFTGSQVDQPSVMLSLRVRDAPGARYRGLQEARAVSAQNFSGGQRHLVEEFTEEIYPRLRGQQVQFKIESDDIGVAWQGGVIRWDGRPDGRK
jgi:hypothetical protein